MKEILGPNQKTIFWKPVRGEALVGLVCGIQATRFKREAVRLAVPGVGSVAVSLNSQLRSLPWSSLVGRWVYLAYSGDKETKNGSLKLFSVALLEESEVEKKMAGVDVETLKRISEPNKEFDDVPF